MEIKYTEQPDGMINEDCPYNINSETATSTINRIGSISCQNKCKHFDNIDFKTQTVTCNHPGESNG